MELVATTFIGQLRLSFANGFKRHHMSDAAKTWANIAGRVGIAARGFVYAVIGIFGMRAAWRFDPSLIKTTEDAMAVFNDNPTDEWILAILGIGVYCVRRPHGVSGCLSQY